MTDEPKTHDYSRPSWGHAFHISEVIDGGRQIRGSYHGGRIRNGDYVILPSKDGKTTRYQITHTEWTVTVDDMYHFEANFAPRSEGSL